MVHTRVGTDIVAIKRVASLDSPALKKIFLADELTDTRPAHLAGLFAAKEAVFKALTLTPRWKEVSILKKRSGKPYAVISSALIKKASLPSSYEMDISISHDGEYAIACAVIVYS